MTAWKSRKQWKALGFCFDHTRYSDHSTLEKGGRKNDGETFTNTSWGSTPPWHRHCTNRLHGASGKSHVESDTRCKTPWHFRSPERLFQAHQCPYSCPLRSCKQLAAVLPSPCQP